MVEIAQEGILAAMAEGGMAHSTLGEDKAHSILGEDKAQGTLEEDKAQGTSGVGTQEEAGTAACTAAGGKTLFWSLRI
jgi:hypothetical protein